MALNNSLDSPAFGQVKALTQSKQFWTNTLAGLLMAASMFGYHWSLDPVAAGDHITSFFSQTWEWLAAAGAITTQVSTIFRTTSDGARIVGFFKPPTRPTEPPTRPTENGWI